MTRTVAGTRAVVAALAAAAVLVLGLLGAAPASAAGVGDVELVPAGTDTSFHVGVAEGGTETATAYVRNTGEAPARVRLYAADASRGSGGGWSIGGPGSAPWIGVGDQVLDLQPGEERRVDVPVTREVGHEGAGAVVMEVATASVVQRAATLVQVEEPPAPPVVPPSLLVPALLAGLLAAAVAGAHALLRRRVGRTPAAAAA